MLSLAITDHDLVECDFNAKAVAAFYLRVRDSIEKGRIRDPTNCGWLRFQGCIEQIFYYQKQCVNNANIYVLFNV